VASLRLFGGLSIETAAGPLSGRAAQRRRLALLALLAASRGMSREKLIAYLWPDVDSERGRHLLSDSVYRINKALGDTVVIAAGDELRLDAERLPSDLSAFERALEQARPADAVAACGGAFLDGFFLDGAPDFDEWVERERDRLARLHARAVEALAEQCERAGDPGGAAEWWYALAALDPLSPRIALRLIRALEAADERAAALRHAHDFAARFRREIGGDIDPEVLEAARQLRTGPAAGASAAAAVAAWPASAGRGEEAPAPPRGPAPSPRRAPNDRAAEAGSPGVTPPSARPAATADRPPAAAGVQARSRSALPLATKAAALLLPLLTGAGWLWHRHERAIAADPVPAVAVLPFADLSPAGDHAYFAAGIMEEIASALTRMERLRVVAPAASEAATDVDIQSVGRALGVHTVLGGSISRWGDSVRVNAKLVRVADRAYLWSETYTSRLGSIFVIQDSIARAIGHTLAERLVGRDPAVLAEPAPAELEAYNLYLRGRYAWHRRTQESLAGAVQHFERAVALAPDYARAHAGLADAYAVQGFYDYRPPRDAFERAESAARRALEIDPSLAQAHATLGYVNLYYHWNWPEAERAFMRAIRLDPGYSTAHQWLANHLTAMGRFREAEQAMRRAMELDPLSLIANGALGWVYFYAGEYERAIEQCERTLELDAAFKLAWFWSALAHEQLGRYDDAIVLLERALALSPGSAITRAALAHAHAMNGRPDHAEALLAELLAGEPRYVPAFEVAKVHLALDDRRSALDWLERAYAQRSHSMAFLAVDPQLAPLRGEPRFADLLRRVGHRD
jgi:DNA-binding SARP family transcriptional activator/TolB-like protein